MYKFFILLLCLSTNIFAQIEYPFAGGFLSVPMLNSKENLKCTGCEQELPLFVKKYFNKPGNFHGPNCYNTSLIASGVMSEKQIRYVSPEEFKEIIKINFKKETNLTPMSLIVFDSKSSWGHSGFYLGDNLVFHKKSYATYYHYRITTLDNVGIVEENEWTPNPFNGSMNQFKWPELGSLPMEFYSPVKKKIQYKTHEKLIKKLEAMVIDDSGKWAIMKKWGIVGGNLLATLVNALPDQDPLTKGTLISFRDQIRVYFDEVHFASTRNYERAMSEACLPEDRTQLKELYFYLGNYLNLDDNFLKDTYSKVMGQDKRHCRENLKLKLI